MTTSSKGTQWIRWILMLIALVSKEEDSVRQQAKRV